MKIVKYILLVCLQCLLSSAFASVIINNYDATPYISNQTSIDSTFFYSTSYVGKTNGNTFIIDTILNETSYNLSKQIITIIEFKNQNDKAIMLQFYGTRYRYINVGEVDSYENKIIHLKPSNFINSDKQFLKVTIPPKSNIKTYLIQKPISFKDYFTKKNIVYKYSNKFLMPEFEKNTSKETVGFCILILFLLGMVFLLFIFYGLAFINLKDKIYLSYSVYLGFTFLQVLYMSQYTFAKCFVLFNYIGNSCFDECTKGLMVAAYCVFYKQAFNIERKNKIILYTLNLLLFISILYVLIMFFSYVFKIEYYFEPTYFISYRAPLFLLSLLFILATIRLKNKTSFQNIILFGSLLYTLFTIFSFLQDVNIPFENMMISIHGLYLGVALELIVFSIALGLRIRDSYLATEQLQDKLIQGLQKNEEFIRNENYLLEERVKERVSEIKQQNIFIEEQKRNALIQNFEKEKIEIQMQALSAQMNPHFIFNCMNSIQHSIVTNNTEKASTMLHDFASLIRMVLENSSQPDITLENEINLLETYLKLEQVRTNFSFDYEINIENEIATDFVRIPTMMLQPFLENAIWHGFKFINYKGKIIIEFSIIDNSIHCSITDNGIGREKAAKNIASAHSKKSMAIQIIKNRINLINQTTTNNKNAALNIIDLKDKKQNAIGTKVIIELPVL